MPSRAAEPARLQTERLVLEPVRVDHASEVVTVLADAELYSFTGGVPPARAELRARYERWTSPEAREQGWLNWIVREGASGRAPGPAVGTVQATISGDAAELAWVIGVSFQGRGYAKEAARGVLAWLRGRGVRAFTAHVHPEHAASAGVARALGLAPVGLRADGEERWERTEDVQRT